MKGTTFKIQIGGQKGELIYQLIPYLSTHPQLQNPLTGGTCNFQQEKNEFLQAKQLA